MPIIQGHGIILHCQVLYLYQTIILENDIHEQVNSIEEHSNIIKTTEQVLFLVGKRNSIAFTIVHITLFYVVKSILYRVATSALT